MTTPRSSAKGSSNTFSTHNWKRLLLLSFVLLGFALRIHDLAGQSMWSDEGLSLYRSQLSLSEIGSNIITVDGIATRDTNPPLYFLLLHLLKLLVGDEIFSLRFLGVAIATFSVPLIYNLGMVSFGGRIGLIAALLIAISPFHVWQSQVLRNYSLLLTLSLFSVYGLLRYILTSPGRRQIRWLVLWSIAGLLSIYAHYFGFFVFAYTLIVIAIQSARESNVTRFFKKKRLWAASGLVLLILVPALVISLDRFAAGQQFDFYRVLPSTVLQHAASAFSVGVSRNLIQPLWRVLPVILIAFLGLFFGWLQNPYATILLIGYQIVPIAFLLLLSRINPLYNGVRHLLFILPPFLVFVAAGIAGPQRLDQKNILVSRIKRRWRWLGPVFAGFVVISQLAWLNAQFNSPSLIRDDVRGAAEYLNTHALPEDVIILHDTLIKFAFDYYYEGASPVEVIPRFGKRDEASAIEELEAESKNRRRLWFLTQPRPRTGFDRSLLSEWAGSNWPRFFVRRFPAMWLRVQLEGYIPQATVNDLPEAATPTSVNWDKTLQLHGFENLSDATAGVTSWASFYLSQSQTILEQHTLSLRLLDEQGNLWAQMDDDISRGFPPTATAADVIMRYDHQLTIPAGTPPGQYQLWLRLVRTSDGLSIPTSSGELDVFLTEVAVNTATCDASIDNLPADVKKTVKIGSELELVGYDLPTDTLRPGHPLKFDIWWCAKERPKADYLLRLQLLDDSEKLISESIGPLSRPDYPPSQWQAAELTRSLGAIDVPAKVETGTYNLRLSLLSPDSNEALRAGWALGRHFLPIGSFQVEQWPKETELPPLGHTLLADFGKPALIELHGYDLATNSVLSGDTLNLDLGWRSLAEDIATSYTVFIHLVSESEEIVAQVDSIPAGGFRPTTSWRSGEVILDSHAVVVPPETAGGTYQIWVGLYDANTGERLPIIVDSKQQPDGRLLLETIEVKE